MDYAQNLEVFFPHSKHMKPTIIFFFTFHSTYSATSDGSDGSVEAVVSLIFFGRPALPLCVFFGDELVMKWVKISVCFSR